MPLCGAYDAEGGGLKDAQCVKMDGFICQRQLDAPTFCGSDGWTAYEGLCYKYFNDFIPWDRARLQCELLGAGLVTPLTSDVQEFITDLANQTSSWIGLHSSPTEKAVGWQWPDGSDVNSTFWAQNQPNISESHRNNSCGAVEGMVATNMPLGRQTMQTWTVWPCEQEHSYICQKAEVSCAEGWKSFASRCYQYNLHLSLTWGDAVDHCHSQGSRLVRITDQDTQNFMNSYLEELRLAGIQDLWIGLHDPKGAGSYVWSDGTPLTGYKHFPEGQAAPNGSQSCHYISTVTLSGEWISGHCLDVRPFVCEARDNRTVNDLTTPIPKYECNSSEGWLSLGDQCFLFSEEDKTWPASRLSCQAVGGDLAQVADKHAQSFINEHLTSTSWIGLNDRLSEGRLSWLDDQQQASYFYADNIGNEEDKDCAVALSAEETHLGSLGSWLLHSCTEIHTFVCQKPALNAVNPTTPKPTTQGSWSGRCGPGWESYGESCYIFTDQQRTWTDARSLCQQNDGELASIVDALEQSYVTGRVQSLSSVWLWIGGNDLSSEGVWEWADNSALAFINWGAGRPDDKGGSDCVGLRTSRGTWSDLPCHTQNGFICKKPARPIPSTLLENATTPKTITDSTNGGLVPGCEPGWKAFSGRCYRVKVVSTTWSEAQSDCQRQGGNLASVAGVGEQDFIHSQLQMVLGPVWLGLNSRRKSRLYEWSDGSDVVFTNWGRNEPNNQLGGPQNCVTFNANRQAAFWSDEDCGRPGVLGYVCKKAQTAVSPGTPYYQVGCSEGWVGYGKKCYFFSEVPKTFPEAEGVCKQAFGHLATVNDRFVQAFLTSELASRSGIYWIGLKTDRTTYYYRAWADGSRIRFTNWDSSHTGRERRSCVYIRSDRPIGLWLNSPCTEKKPFVCEMSRELPTPPTSPSTAPPARCPARYSEHKGYCYRLYTSSEKYTFSEARGLCHSEGAGLPSIHSADQAKWIRDRIIRYSSYRRTYWLGLTTGHSGFRWLDSTPADYTQWGKGQPDNHNSQENCVVWESRGNFWEDNNCFIRRALICQLEKGGAPPELPTAPATEKPPFSCGSERNWGYFNGSCYYIGSSGTTKTWFDARDYCARTIGGELLSVMSQEENNFVLSRLSGNGGSLYWTGLNELNYNGEEWSDGEPVLYTNWAINEPNDDFGGQKCTTIHNRNGNWYDGNCGFRYPLVCKVRNGTRNPRTAMTTTSLPGYCPSGWRSLGNKCFKAFNRTGAGHRANWTTAAAFCQGLGKTTDLVAINNYVEQLVVVDLLRGQTGTFWLGLNAKRGFRLFLWTDNSPVTFTLWNRGEPNSSKYRPSDFDACVEMFAAGDSAGKWNDNGCEVEQGFICQMHKDPSQPTPPTTPLPTWCKSGYSVFGSSCYAVTSANQAWDESQLTCRTDGGNLASITDIYESNFVQILAYGLSESLWIGMSDSQSSGKGGQRPTSTNFCPPLSSPLPDTSQLTRHHLFAPSSTGCFAPQTLLGRRSEHSSSSTGAW